jgi:predicted transcriptional regulator
MAKRNKLEIIRDILKIIQENRSIRITPLLRKSNISSSRFKGYYSDLLNKEFIKETHKKNKEISLSEKGSRYLEKYSTIIDFIEEFEL